MFSLGVMEGVNFSEPVLWRDEKEARQRVLGMLCLCYWPPLQWVSWTELEGCYTRAMCRAVLFSGVLALLAKAEELAWKRIVLQNKHIRIGSIMVQGYDMENRCTCGERTNLEKLKLLYIYLLVGTWQRQTWCLSDELWWQNELKDR